MPDTGIEVGRINNEAFTGISEWLGKSGNHYETTMPTNHDDHVSYRGTSNRNPNTESVLLSRVGVILPGQIDLGEASPPLRQMVVLARELKMGSDTSPAISVLSLSNTNPPNEPDGLPVNNPKSALTGLPTGRVAKAEDFISAFTPQASRNDFVIHPPEVSGGDAKIILKSNIGNSIQDSASAERVNASDAAEEHKRIEERAMRAATNIIFTTMNSLELPRHRRLARAFSQTITFHDLVELDYANSY